MRQQTSNAAGDSERPKTGIVLSGGGARGAYEAGVLKYIRDELPQRVRRHIHLDVICGTSVGALNACFIAASAHHPEMQGRMLAQLWESLNIQNIYKITLKVLGRLPRFMFGSGGRGHLDNTAGPGRLGGLLDTSPLEQLLHKGIRWENIKRNLERGDFSALSINATHLSSGKTHTFVQRKEGILPPWSTDAQVKAMAVDIRPEHALASAAIPWIFPAVDINGDIYCDGGLKLNTPISPAIRLGANRLLVIGLSQPDTNQENQLLEVDQYPSALFILGKILNALLLDKTEYDLNRLNRFNALLAAGKSAYGKDFEKQLGDAIVPLRGSPYRQIDNVFIRPNEDIGELASRHGRLGSVSSRAGGLVGSFIRHLASNSADSSSGDLLSYLLFDGEYAADLIKMGMRDADARRQELINFFQV